MPHEPGKFSSAALRAFTDTALALKNQGEHEADIALAMLAISTLAMKKANVDKKEIHTLVDLLYATKE